MTAAPYEPTPDELVVIAYLREHCDEQLSGLQNIIDGQMVTVADRAIVTTYAIIRTIETGQHRQ